MRQRKTLTATLATVTAMLACEVALAQYRPERPSRPQPAQQAERPDRPTRGGVVEAQASDRQQRGGRGDRVVMMLTMRIDENLQQAREVAADIARTNNDNDLGHVQRYLRKAAEAVEELKRYGLSPDDPRLTSAEQKIAETHAACYRRMEPALRSAAGSTQMPADAYAGDREALKQAVRQAWKERWPDDQILAVTLPEAQPKRQQKYVWNDASKAWEHRDHSVLAAMVAVKLTDNLAVIYPAYRNEDHVDGTTNFGVETKSGQYVTQVIAVEKVAG